MFIVAFTFVLCVGLVLGIYWMFVVRVEDNAIRALRRRLTAAPSERAARTDLTKKDAPFSALKMLDVALARSGRLVAPVKRAVADSGLRVTIGAVLLSSGFLATATLVTFALVSRSFALSAAASLVAAALPYIWVRSMAARRVKRLEEQLPEAVDLIAVSLRAGHAFTTGLLMVAEEIPAPLGNEFRLLYDQQKFGKPLPDVLREFANRVPLLDARILVTAVLTQRETGGNLAEVLDKLSAVIRERFRIRRQVRSLSAHGRVTGYTLGFLPPVLAAILFVVAPAHMRILIDDPVGRNLLFGAGVLQVIGMVAVRRIVRVEF